jgi:hypothetical protein
VQRIKVREIKSPAALAACGLFLVPEPFGICFVLAAAIWWLRRKMGCRCPPALFRMISNVFAHLSRIAAAARPLMIQSGHSTAAMISRFQGRSRPRLIAMSADRNQVKVNHFSNRRSRVTSRAIGLGKTPLTENNRPRLTPCHTSDLDRARRPTPM